MSAAVEIRRLSSLEEIAAAAGVFDAVWEAPARERVPRELLRALTAHTCPLLGAFDGETCVGVVLGEWARDDDGAVWLWSSRLGVPASHRRRGIAEALKRRQAEIVRDAGVAEIRWTFDPIRARNAAFNLARLGAVGIRFYEDLYGERADRFNAGERTDRMLVRWRPFDPPAPHGSGDALRIEIPADVDAYRALPLAQRRAWRHRVADALRAAFDDGFAATGFEAPATYVLTRGGPP